MMIAWRIRIHWDYMKSSIHPWSPSIINAYFLGRKPPRIRANDFRKSEHVHVIVAVSSSETLLYDFVLVAGLPVLLVNRAKQLSRWKFFLNLDACGWRSCRTCLSWMWSRCSLENTTSQFSKAMFLSVLPTLRVLLKHAFTLDTISMHFFKQKCAYRPIVVLCFLARNYALIARFKVSFSERNDFILSNDECLSVFHQICHFFENFQTLFQTWLYVCLPWTFFELKEFNELQ